MEHYIQAVSLRWFNACAYYAVALSLGLKTLGYRVTFAGASGTPAVDKAAERGIEVLNKKSKKSENPLELIRVVKKYRKFVLSNSVKLVNVHHGHDHLLWFLALRGTGIPLIRTSGNQIPPRIHMFSRFLNNKGTTGIIASCKTIQDFYKDGFDLEAEKIPVINGGVDTDYYSTDYSVDNRFRLRSKMGVPDKAFIFGIIGRFSPDKGHKYFFRAAGIIGKLFPEVWFLAAGWDAQLNEKDIRRMAGEAGVLDRTVFPGRYPDSKDIIGCIDAGVIASIGSETICRIAMEYMAMGVPVIATDTNVIPEIIRNNETGYIVPSGNSEAMATAMKQLLASRDRARILGENGREISKREYSLESFALQTVEAYGRLIGYGQ